MRDLIGYVLKRAFWMLLTLWAVYTVSFVLMRSVPGNPFSGERSVPPAIERQLKAREHQRSDASRISETKEIADGEGLEGTLECECVFPFG